MHPTNAEAVAPTPLVSVVIPAYNAEAYLERTLRSVLSQTYQNLEIIVVDDGSTDRTAAIACELAATDPRLQILHQKNAGVAAARNLGIQRAKGEFIAPIDADDIWYAENIEKQVHCFLHADESIGVVYSWSVDIDDEDNPLGECDASLIQGDVYNTLVCHNFIGNASATMIRRTCLNQVGGYNCTLKDLNAQGCEDWDLYLRLAERYHFKVVPEFLVGYRKIVGSMSRNYDAMARSHAFMLLFARERRPETPMTAYRLSGSSFYLYLARQSRQHRCYRGTLYWLNQALQADITPVFRLGLYVLLLESFIKLTIKEFSAFVGVDNSYWVLIKRSIKSTYTNWVAMKAKTPNPQQLGVRLKLVVGEALHYFTTIAFAPSRRQT